MPDYGSDEVSAQNKGLIMVLLMSNKNSSRQTSGNFSRERGFNPSPHNVVF